MPSFVALLIAIASLGCATPKTIDEVEADIIRSVNLQRQSSGVRVIPIHASSSMEAWTRLAEARSDPESAESLRLGRAFRLGETRRVTLVIGGPHPELSEQLVINGLHLNQGRGLRGLTIVMVGPDPPSDRLRAAAGRAGAEFQYRLLR